MTKRLCSLLLSPLFWLVLALPFGSPAAAAMPPCHHAQAMPHVGAHVAAAPVAMHAQAGHDQSCASHASGSHRDHGRCGSCPACCAGVALAPPSLRAPPDPGPAFVAIPFRAGHMPSVDPALLERPPSTSFA